jgi:hypothetical protein
MNTRTMRTARLALRTLVGSAAAVSVGCTTPEKKDQFANLDPSLQARLQAAAPSSKTAAVKPATFDPTRTGGSGVNVQNSFGRTTPQPGTGSSAFAVSLPPPQLGTQPPMAAPTLPGTSYATAPANPADPVRTAMSDRPAQPTALQPVNAVNPPATEPPMTRANYEKPAVQPLPPVLSTPNRDLEPPLPIPPVRPSNLPPIPPSTSATLPPTPVGEKLPPIPSATEGPIPGAQPAVRIPPADPIRPY